MTALKNKIKIFLCRLRLVSSGIEFDFWTMYSSVAVFLFFSLCLFIDSGYSYGAGLLLLAGLCWVWRPLVWQSLNKQDWLVIFALVFYCFVWWLSIAINMEGSRELDKPSRFLLAAISLLFLLRYPPKPVFLWTGLALGCFLVGSWSLYQKIFEGVARAGGYTNTIQFGNISLLMGLMCLAGMGWAKEYKNSKFWFALLATGLAFGLLGSLLSGSRGGWLALPLALIVIYKAYQDTINIKHLVVLSIAFVFFIFLVYLMPATNV